MTRAFVISLAAPLLVLLACDPVGQETDLRPGRAQASASLAGRAEDRLHNEDAPQRAERPRPVREAVKARPAEARRQAPRDEEADSDADSDVARAPDRYAVKLDTTKGEIIIDVTRAWAPRGADRFHELVKAGYYTDCAFFRVLDGFMAQTGINGDPAVNNVWRNKRIADDPPEQSNTRGMVSFAMAGPNSRTTQFFINFSDNNRLDSMGFAPFGRVRDMTVVDTLNAEYGEGAPRGRGPSQGQMQSEGNTYLKRSFPNLDYIRSAQLLR